MGTQLNKEYHKTQPSSTKIYHVTENETEKKNKSMKACDITFCMVVEFPFLIKWGKSLASFDDLYRNYRIPS